MYQLLIMILKYVHLLIGFLDDFWGGLLFFIFSSKEATIIGVGEGEEECRVG